MKRFLLSAAVVFVASQTLAAAEDSAAETLGLMYWTDRTVGIYCAARDGSDIELIVSKAYSNSIAVDCEGGRLYWTRFSIDPVDRMIYWTSQRGTLRRAKLDGSQRQQLAGGLDQPDGLALDFENRKLYWAEKGKIRQANLDGSGIELLVSGKSELYSSLEILPPADGE